VAGGNENAANPCITRINWLILFKKIIAVYSEDHMKPIYTLQAKHRISDCESRWCT
jgi:hypothetical protein